MTDISKIERTSVTERLVLHGLVELERRDRTPAETLDVLEQCRDDLDRLDEFVAGRLTEADLVRACRTLSERELVAEIEPDATSPVGKGRPAYGLDADPDDVFAVVSGDDRFEGLATDDAS